MRLYNHCATIVVYGPRVGSSQAIVKTPAS